MLKVVVFDSGWGGEMVADYIEEELSVVEVVRVIDWRNAPYSDKSRQKIQRLVEDALIPFIGNVDLIVLGGFVMRFLLDSLKKRFPEQKFVAVDMKPMSISLRATHNIMILANQKLRETEYYQKIRNELMLFDVFEPKCDHWTQLIDDGEMTEQILRCDLEKFAKRGIDTVLVMNTHFWDIKKELEKVLGYQVRIVDQKELLKKQICMALEFEGARYAV